MKTNNRKNLAEIHEDVPATHYDIGIKKNLFQKYWHYKRFMKVLEVVRAVEGPFLDLGCHSGTFTEKILKKIKSKKVYGVDISKNAIDLIRKRIPYGDFRVADAANLPYKNDFFDAVFCLEMLEHVDNPESVLSEIQRVLKKGGYCVILVPTDNTLFKLVWFIWTLYYPVWRHAHVQSYQKENLEEALKRAKLKISSVKHFNLGMLKLIVCEK